MLGISSMIESRRRPVALVPRFTTKVPELEQGSTNQDPAAVMLFFRNAGLGISLPTIQMPMSAYVQHSPSALSPPEGPETTTRVPRAEASAARRSPTCG